MECKTLSALIYSELKEETEKFMEKADRAPGLAVISCGDDEASKLYVKTKTQKAEELGFVHFQYSFSGDCGENVLLDTIRNLNSDSRVDGILLQLPLPPGYDEKKLTGAIAPEKDVDGFTPYNLGRLLKGEECFIPCTPLGILKIMEHYGIPTDGANILVVGRSDIVGKPLAAALMQKGRDATVTVAHSRTRNLKALTLSSDVIVLATGRPGLLTEDMVSDGTAIIDVGINRIEDRSRKRGWRTVGDAAFPSFLQRDVKITPVPGGVGLMTVCCLMSNTLLSARRREGLA